MLFYIRAKGKKNFLFAVVIIGKPLMKYKGILFHSGSTDEIALRDFGGNPVVSMSKKHTWEGSFGKRERQDPQEVTGQSSILCK